jgi:hypothetical protein
MVLFLYISTPLTFYYFPLWVENVELIKEVINGIVILPQEPKNTTIKRRQKQKLPEPRC